jgi:hypothetical protein
MEELWKTVITNNDYVVSNFGRVRRTRWTNGAKRIGRILGYNLENGYREVCFFDAKHNRKTKLIHQVVCDAFLGPCPDGYEINHKDGDKRNNHLDNLEYVTPSQNIRHALETGLMVPARGTQISTSVLTNRQVRRIRERFKNGASMSDISRRLKIGLTTVSDIVNRRTWTHI